MQAQKRLQQIGNWTEILASVFGDLDPRAEEKEGRPLRAILGDRLDQAASELEGDTAGDPLIVANYKIDWVVPTGRWDTPPKPMRCSRRRSRSARLELGPDDPDTLAVMSHQALALKDAGDFNGAIALLERVRESQLRVLPADHEETSATSRELAVSYWMVGRSTEACSLLEQVRDSLVKQFGPDDARTIDTLDNLSAVYVSVGKQTEAIALAEQVRDARVKLYGVDHMLAIASLKNLAIRYQAAGKMRQALTLFEKARDESGAKVRVRPPDHTQHS